MLALASRVRHFLNRVEPDLPNHTVIGDGDPRAPWAAGAKLVSNPGGAPREKRGALLGRRVAAGAELPAQLPEPRGVLRPGCPDLDHAGSPARFRPVPAPGPPALLRPPPPP